MTAVRRLLAHRHLAVLICLAALAMKLLIPGGYMVSAEQGQLSIMVCPGVMPAPEPAPMAMAMHGDAGHHEQQKQHGQVEQPCAFAGLSHQALGAADPVLLAAAISYIMATAAAPAPHLRLSRIAHLRPPLRGPPATL